MTHIVYVEAAPGPDGPKTDELHRVNAALKGLAGVLDAMSFGAGGSFRIVIEAASLSEGGDLDARVGSALDALGAKKVTYAVLR